MFETKDARTCLAASLNNFDFSELVEHNDELQTQLLNRQVKEGRNLLAEQQENMTAEMGNMTEEQVSVKTGKH